MDDVEQRLERKKTVVRPGRSVHIRNVPTIYLEDVTKIYNIMAEAKRDSPWEQAARESKLVTRKLQETANDTLRLVAETSQKLGRDSQLSKPIEIEAMPEAPSASPVSLESNEYIFKNLDEFRALRRSSVRELTISIDYPRLYLNCDAVNCYLRVGSDEPEALSAYEEIKAILKSRSSHFWRFVNHPLFTLFIYLVLVAGWWLFVVSNDLPDSYGTIGFTIAAPIALVLMVAMEIAWRRRKVVISKNKVDAPSAWEQNRKSIILGGLSIILTALLSALFYRLIVGTGS